MSTTPADFDPAPWERLLAGAARRHRVPGIVAGVLRIDPTTGVERRMVAATGVTNLATGVSTDADTVCQIGSITKVVTATMILQLRDEGRLALEDSLASLLPGFHLAGDLADRVTVRHLLTHTSGIDGDLFTDTGRGDDCLEKYVATLSEADSLFTPGSGWSYCNSGFVVLGRIIEVLDERTWDASLRARVTEPLGLTRFVTLPEEVLRHRAALGHIRYPGSPDVSPAPVSGITRSMGPAGLITSSADDLLSFGAAFLRGGLGAGGQRLLAADTVAEMTRLHHTLPAAAGGMAPEWGLGWMRDAVNDTEGTDDGDAHPYFWHGGTTIGQNAWLLVLPQDGVALVVFTNGGAGPVAAAEVRSALLETFVGAVPPPPRVPTGPAEDADADERWFAEYADASTTLTLERPEEGGLRARMRSEMDLSHPDGLTLDLFPTADPDQFLFRDTVEDPWSPVGFTEVDGRPVVYAGIRVLPRRGDAAPATAEGPA